MKLSINGTSTELADKTTVAQLVAQRADPGSRVAVALNGEVVRRSEWVDTALNQDDEVELLAAVAGG